jgi:uncharacterized protein RhaS with RHS repeats
MTGSADVFRRPFAAFRFAASSTFFFHSDSGLRQLLVDHRTWLSGASIEERAVIVQLDFGREEVAEQLEEVRSPDPIGGCRQVCAVVQGRRHSPDAATYAGKGKVEEIAAEGGRTRRPTWSFSITS